jgi:ubiquitin carboxyl-terminal hydrolase 25/28
VYTGRSKEPPSVLGMEIHDAPVEDARLTDDLEMDEPHAPYRPPEAVIEPAEEHPPGYVPGVVEEHMDEDDYIMPVSPLRDVGDLPRDFSSVNRWQSEMSGHDKMEVDDAVLDKPQIGPGVFPRLLLQMVHEHELLQPQLTDLPQPPVKKPAPAPSPKPTPALLDPSPASPLHSAKFGQPSISPSLPDYERICTRSDVWDACPGGEQTHDEWYFCPTCWGWIRVVLRQDPQPEVDDMEHWEAMITNTVMAGFQYPGISSLEDIPAARSKRFAEYCRYNDIRSSIKILDRIEDHYHEFQTLTYPCRETRLDRISSEHAEMNAFPHLELPLQSSWQEFVPPTVAPRLFVSCTSGRWVQIDEGIIPGQIPRGLASAFSLEKASNPGPGLTAKQSVADAWNMLCV